MAAPYTLPKKYLEKIKREAKPPAYGPYPKAPFDVPEKPPIYVPLPYAVPRTSAQFLASAIKWMDGEVAAGNMSVAQRNNLYTVVYFQMSAFDIWHDQLPEGVTSVEDYAGRARAWITEQVPDNWGEGQYDTEEDRIAARDALRAELTGTIQSAYDVYGARNPVLYQQIITDPTKAEGQRYYDWQAEYKLYTAEADFNKRLEQVLLNAQENPVMVNGVVQVTATQIQLRDEIKKLYLEMGEEYGWRGQGEPFVDAYHAFIPGLPYEYGDLGWLYETSESILTPEEKKKREDQREISRREANRLKWGKGMPSYPTTGYPTTGYPTTAYAEPPRYAPAFEEMRAGLTGPQSWRNWFESRYSRELGRFGATMGHFPQVEMGGEMAEKTWADYLKGRKPELYEEWWSLGPYGRGERPHAYQPKIRTVSF